MSVDAADTLAQSAARGEHVEALESQSGPVTDKTARKEPRRKRARASSTGAAPAEPPPTHASFAEVAKAYLDLTYAQNRRDPEPNIAKLTAGLNRITPVFEAEAGVIVDALYAQWIGAAVALTTIRPTEMFPWYYSVDLTSRQRVHHVDPPLTDENGEFIEIVLNADVLAQQAAGLSQADGDRCISMAYGVMKQTLSWLDNREMTKQAALQQNVDYSPSPESAKKTLELLQGELGQAQSLYDETLEKSKAEALDSYQQYGRTRYLLGMLPCAMVVLPIFAFIAYLLLKSRLPVPSLDVGLGFATFIAGAAGAAISVMLRMTAGKLKIQQGLRPSEMVALGAFRPIVGAIFALAFYFFIKSDLIPIAIPTDATAQMYFFPAVGFVAGFSERLARDTIKSVEGTLPNTRSNELGASNLGD